MLRCIDSGAYEKMAKQLLLDPNGQVNVNGQLLVNRLAKRRSGFYWLFWDANDPAPVTCPYCGSGMESYENRSFRHCCGCGMAV
jgi:hypothetical protein